MKCSALVFLLQIGTLHLILCGVRFNFFLGKNSTLIQFVSLIFVVTHTQKKILLVLLLLYAPLRTFQIQQTKFFVHFLLIYLNKAFENGFSFCFKEIFFNTQCIFYLYIKHSLCCFCHILGIYSCLLQLFVTYFILNISNKTCAT